MPEKKLVTIIIPAYNEEASIGSLLADMQQKGLHENGTTTLSKGIKKRKIAYYQ